MCPAVPCLIWRRPQGGMGASAEVASFAGGQYRAGRRQVPFNGTRSSVHIPVQGARHVDAAAGHMTLDAGTTLQAHGIAEEAGMMFPRLSPRKARRGSAGGPRGRGAGASLGTRELASGSRRCGGQLYQAQRTPKDNTGYDLGHSGGVGRALDHPAATLKLSPSRFYETAFLVRSPAAWSCYPVRGGRGIR